MKTIATIHGYFSSYLFLCSPLALVKKNSEPQRDVELLSLNLPDKNFNYYHLSTTALFSLMMKKN